MNRIELIEKVTEDVKERLLLEMATFGRINDGKDMYKIAIHGPASNYRPMPHIHLNSTLKFLLLTLFVMMK